MVCLKNMCTTKKIFLVMGCLLLVCYAINRFYFPFSLERYVTNVMSDWRVPGLAIAIVEGDKVVYIKGFGVLREGKNDVVNEDTIFAIGSCTKAFTAAALGILVDEGLLKWTDKAHTYLPNLRASDACVTKELDIKDLLSHRAGLEEVGMLWDHTTLSRNELIQRIRYLKPFEGFRQGWVYNNLLYLAAGEIVHAISGISWDDFINKRIFEPLGMDRSSTTIKALVDEINVAVPHYAMQGAVHPVAYHNIDSIAPAGGINSTIKDMAQWLLMLVNNGEYHERQLIKKETIAEIISPVSIVHKNYPFQLYGLGLGIMTYQGSEIIFHEGNIDGMSAAIAFMPEKKIGVVILANMHRSGIGKVLMNTIFDYYLSVFPKVDWNKKFLLQEQERVKKVLAQEQAKQNSDFSEIDETYEPSRYVGVYHSNLYGDVVISWDQTGLKCTFLAFDGKLTPWRKNSFTCNASKINPLFPASFYFVFSGADKKIDTLNIEYADVWGNEMNAEFIKR